MKFAAAPLFALLLATAASAQEDERIKRIVDRIEKEIRESHDRTREEIRAIIRAEIQKGGAKPATPSRPEAPTARKATLGITADDLTEEERKAHAKGIKIADVRGPAKDAGLQAGDFLLEIDQSEITEDNIGEILSKHKPGDSVELTILRGKKSRHVKVVLGERKD